MFDPFKVADISCRSIVGVAHGYLISRLRRDDGVEEKTFLDDLSNSGPAVRLYGEGRATGPPKD